MYRRTLMLLWLGLVAISSTLIPWNSPPANAQLAIGTIAYVRGDTGDEIRLIEPDGSNDRHLWAHGVPDQHNVYHVYNMAWRPDARELSFASTHENWCSINYSDVFSIAPDGSRYRRITQAPDCASLAQYPTGTVRVPVKNVSMYGNSFVGFVYFQGAPSVQPVSLLAGASTTVVFENVADFGDEFLQIAAFIDGANREYSVGTAVDVEAGMTVTAGQLSVTPPQNMGWEPRSPTWRSNGATLGYAYGYSSLYGIDANPSPVEFGSRLINPGSGPNLVEYMAYGPAGARANQILYEGYDTSEIGVYLVTEGSTESGELLFTTGYYLLRGLTWLPDGSGFLYSVEEEEDYEITRANLFEYSFATRQSKRLTSFPAEFAGQMSVSPDGQQIVFDLAQSRESGAATDVWIMNRDGSAQRLLINNAYAPAWSPGALPAPLTARAYIPLIQR